MNNNSNTPQDQDPEVCPEACNCNNPSPHCSCQTAPAGDAFVDPSEINPRRRIVRAMRPPLGASPSAATSTTNVDNAAAAPSALVSGGNNADNNTNNNDGGTISGDATSTELSDELGFLRQLNDGQGPSGNGADTAGSDGGETPSNATVSTGNDANRAARRRHAPPQEEYDDEPEYEEEAEESEDDGSFGPPSHFFHGFLNHMMRNANRRPGQKLSSKIRPDDDDEDSEDENEDTIARCAACFRDDNQNHKWRRLVTLPCCGTNGREANSSTRFCAACILELAVTRAGSANNSEYRLYDDEPDEYPIRKFYQKSLQAENRRFCECPRCRAILLVKIRGIKPVHNESDDDSSECECDCSDCEAERRERSADGKEAKTAKSISLQIPSFKAKCWHIGRKRGMAKLLWKVSLLHHNFMPYEAIGGDEEKAIILKLAGYGVIERVPGKRNKSVYRIDKEDQTKLIKFFRLTNPSEKDQTSENNLVMEIETCMMYAAWRHLRDEYRIDRSLRILNRFFFLGLHFFGYLPPLPLAWPQELVVTVLIVFSVALSLQFLCVLAVYAAVFLGVGLSVCYVLKRSNNVKSCWWQVILVSYFVYKANRFFYENSYMKWSVLVTPKAMVPVKKMLWG